MPKAQHPKFVETHEMKYVIEHAESTPIEELEEQRRVLRERLRKAEAEYEATKRKKAH